MAAKLIVLSGTGRGIARIYETHDELRAEITATVSAEEKRIAVVAGDRVYSADFPGREISLRTENFGGGDFSVIVYSGGKCLISGANRGRCDIACAMNAIYRHDSAENRLNIDSNPRETAKNAGIDGGESELNDASQEMLTAEEISAESAINDNAAAAQDSAVFSEESASESAPITGDTEIEAESFTASETEEKPESPAQITECGIGDCTLANAMLEEMEKVNDSAEAGRQPFYMRVGDKLNEMFGAYPHDKELENLVFNSKWIRIPYEDDSYYVLGVISDENAPVFICYGVPAERMEKPCYEIEDSCEWLPLDKFDIAGKGYWLVYQDALTGENIS